MSTEVRSVAWMQVLDRIKDALEQSLGLATEPSSGPPLDAAALQPLQSLDERLGRMQERLTQAERNAATADAVLAAEIDTFRHWLAAFAAARQRLADWAARPVVT